MRLLVIVFGMCFCVSCGLKAPPQPPVPSEVTAKDTDVYSEASVGVQDLKLRALLEDHWETTMKASPVWATDLGDHRFDDQLGDNRLEVIRAFSKQESRWLAKAKAISRDTLVPSDILTLDLFIGMLEVSLETEVCQFATWSISPRNNLLGDLNSLAETHLVSTSQDGANLIKRYQAFPGQFDNAINNLRVGLEQGLVANAASVRLVIEMLDRQLAEPFEQWPTMAPSLVSRDGWSDEENTAFKGEVSAVNQDALSPAIKGYRDFIRDEILPKARLADAEGVGALPNGEDCYNALARKFTTLERTPDEIHQQGLEELDRIHKAMLEVSKRLWDLDSLPPLFDRLRTDEALFFETREGVHNKAEEALARATEAMTDWFGVLPKAGCQVVPIPEYEAPYTTIAYYRPANPDGSRPGSYYINTYAPETRPRHEAEALAFHEAIPGHHLQISIAQEQDALPLFRRHMGMTAFVEGWALYTEQLAEEMGLYSGDVDLLGMYSFELWRASRLVVDTGLHAKDWSRQQAIDFMLANTPLAENNIINEVDRYVTTPGQALAYKTGQMEIWRLRREAEAALGESFDIRQFHDTVLLKGAVTLPVLADQVGAWVDSYQ